jgi:hypothetical protein
MALEAFFERYATLPIVLVALAVYFGSFLVMRCLSPEDKIQESLNKSKVAYFRAGRTFAYDPQKLYAMLDVFNKQPGGDELKKEYKQFFYYDFVFPLLYSSTLAIIIAYFQKRWNIEKAEGGIEPIELHYLWALPLLAMVFDYLENFSLLYVLNNYEGAPMPSVVGFSRLMTMIKLIFIYASMFLAFCVFLLWARDGLKFVFKSKSTHPSASP